MAMSYIDYRIKHRQHQKERGEEKPSAPAVGRQAGKSSPASSDTKKKDPGTSFIDYKINNRKEQVKQNGYERYGTYTASPQTAAQGPQATQMAAPMAQDNPYMKAAVRQMLPAYQRPVDPITAGAANMLRNNARGNIDLYNRPQYRQPDGSISTVNSISIGTDEGAIPSVNGKGMEVLIPTIGRDKNGRPVQWTDEQAIENYRKTGENLGKFNTVEEANDYAERLHRQQEAYYSPENSPLRLNNVVPRPYELGDAVQRFQQTGEMYISPELKKMMEEAPESGQGIRSSTQEEVNAAADWAAQRVANAEQQQRVREMRTFDRHNPVIAGALQGTGLPSMLTAGEQALARLTGNEEAQKQSAQIYADELREAQGLQARHPLAYNVGNVAGNIATVVGIGKVIGAIPAFANMSNLAQAVVSGAGAMGGTTAIQEAGAASTGMISPKDYALDIATGAGAGAAGGAVSSQIAGAGMNFLRNHGLTGNALAQTVVAGLSSSGYSGAGTAVRQGSAYLRDPANYQFDAEQAAKDAAVAFAFGAFSFAWRNRQNFTMNQEDPNQRPSTKYFDDCKTPGEIDSKLRQYARQYHPDQPTGNADLFAEISAEATAMKAWMNVNNGAQAYQKAQEAYASGDTAKYQEAQQEYNAAVDALMVDVQSGAIQGQEAVEALQILQSVSANLAGPEAQAPATPESDALAALAEQGFPSTAPATEARLLSTGTENVQVPRDAVATSQQDIPGNPYERTAAQKLDTAARQLQALEYERNQQTLAEQPAMEGQPAGGQGSLAEVNRGNAPAIEEQPAQTGDQKLAALAAQATANQAEQKNAQIRAIYEAGKTQNPDFQAIMDRATMLTEAEKTDAFYRGLTAAAAEAAGIGKEISYGGQQQEEGNYLSGEGSGRNLPLSAGERDGGVPSEAGGTAEGWQNWTAAADPGLRGGSEGTGSAHVTLERGVPAEKVIRTAAPGQVIYPVKEGGTPAMRKTQARIIAYDPGIQQVPFASKGDVLSDKGEYFRAYADPVTRQIGYRINDEQASSDKTGGIHEVLEMANIDGKIDLSEAEDLARHVIPGKYFNEIVKAYQNNGPKRSGIRHAIKEALFDITAGINQFEGVDNYKGVAMVVDYAHGFLYDYFNDVLGGVFDAEYDETAAPAVNAKTTAGTSAEATAPSRIVGENPKVEITDKDVSVDNIVPTITEMPENPPEYSSTLYREPAQKELFTLSKDGDISIKEKLYMSGRDFLIKQMKEKGYRDKKNTLAWLDKTADFMDKAEAVYTYIGLDDIKNTKLVIDPRSGNIVLRALVKNGEYPVNIDLTKECTRRIALGKFVDWLSRNAGRKGGKTMLEEVPLTASNLVLFNKILKDEGFDTACLGCFVETRRYRIQEWADSFIEKYNNAVEKNNPGADYFNFADKNVYVSDLSKKDLADLNEALESYKANVKEERNAKKAFAKAEKERLKSIGATKKQIDDVKSELSNEEKINALVRSNKIYQKKLRVSDLITPGGRTVLHRDFPELESLVLGHYGSNTPKSVELFTPYNYDLGSIQAVGKQTLQDYVAPIAGAREQSFSDSVPTHLMDQMEKTADMAVNKLPDHIYTKVPSEVMLFGLTRRKFNMSIMFNIDPDVDSAHAGLRADGSYFVGDRKTSELEAKAGRERTFVQSFPYDMARKIQHTPGYSKNCGMIGVGYSYFHIKKMLADPEFGYLIGYHPSGMNGELASASYIEKATSYEPVQNTLKIKGLRHVTGELDGLPSYASWPQGTKTTDNKMIEKTKFTMKDFDMKGNLKKYGGKETMRRFLAWLEENRLAVDTSKASYDGVEQHGVGSFPLYEDLAKTKDYRKTADNYITWCLENDMLPEFYEFADDDNYFNFIYDYTPYDHNTGKYSPQLPVQMIFPDNFFKLANHALNQWNNYMMRQEPKEIPTFEKMYDEAVRYSSKLNLSGKMDSAGTELTVKQEEYFKDSKIRDEEGNLLRVYHGTYEDFNVFDKNKGRSTMDIQGSFFTPWDIDAEGYGPNIKTVYLNIKNPAPESVAYKALNMFKGQNNAGTKAREYLISKGYDGVNNNNEEYIAFYPKQIKNIDNQNPTESEDIRYSSKLNLQNNSTENLNEKQQKNFKYNESKTETGDALKTLKGSTIKRSKYGVGKDIGGQYYFHKDYAQEIVPEEVLSQAEDILKNAYPDFSYNAMMYQPAKDTVRFDQAPDFDTAREPKTGDYITVNVADGTTKKGHSDYIWHHKWLWVDNDYDGFDVKESWEWSRQWLSTLTEVADGNGIGRWEAQLDKYGLPHDGQTDEVKPVVQHHTSAGTSINKNKVPVVFTNKNAKFVSGGTNIDIGGGKYDTGTEYLKTLGVTNEIYDPYNRSKENNQQIIDGIRKGKRYDTATISNVLNVIDTPEARANVILEAAKAIKPDGEAYFTFYSDKKQTARETKADQWQEFREARTYKPEIEKFFDDVSNPKGGMIIAKSPKKNLPKAAWASDDKSAVAYSSKLNLNGNEKRDKDDERELYSIARSYFNDAKAGWDLNDMHDWYTLQKPTHGTKTFFSHNIDDVVSYYAEQTGDKELEARVSAMKDYLDRVRETKGTYISPMRDTGGKKNDRGETLTNSQRAYFAESKVRDKNGNLKVMYHGTENANFTVFDPEESDDKISLFFTDNPENAREYSGSYDEFAPDKKVSEQELSEIIDNYTEGDWQLSKTADGYSIEEIAFTDEGITYQEIKRFKTLKEAQTYAYDEILKNGSGYGGRPGNYAVYLNLQNPLVVDADGSHWNEIPYWENEDGELESATTREIAEDAMEMGYDGVIINNVFDNGQYSERQGVEGNIAIAFRSNQVKSIYNENPTLANDIRYSSKLKLRDKENDYAPTFYSKLQREIGNFKGEKIGAASVESYLKGKGVKDEEIKWSGIRTFLEGKKSVNKQELMQYLKANELEIVETTLTPGGNSPIWSRDDGEEVNTDHYYDTTQGTEFSNFEEFKKEAIKRAAEDGFTEPDLVFHFDEDHRYMEATTEDDYTILEAFPPDPYDLRDSDFRNKTATQWDSYKLDGGKNYREILFGMPGSDYINRAMRTHWDRPGVVAHARVQDFDSPGGKKTLFIEEIQSDWHNEGQKYGYKTEDGSSVSEKDADVRFEEGLYTLYVNGEYTGSFFSPEYMERAGIAKKDVKKALIEDYQKTLHLNNLDDTAPDAPFRTTYTDFVLKDLLRMAAEGNYDYLAWTTGKMQEERWSNEFAEGYRIEYDQQIPKFLKKYGKQWGAGLKTIDLNGNNEIADDTYMRDLQTLYDMMHDINLHDISQLSDGIGVLTEDIETAIEHGRILEKDEEKARTIAQKLDNAYNNGILTDKDIYQKVIAYKNSVLVPAITVNDAMKESVLTEGQPMFSTKLNLNGREVELTDREEELMDQLNSSYLDRIDEITQQKDAEIAALQEEMERAVGEEKKKARDRLERLRKQKNDRIAYLEKQWRENTNRRIADLKEKAKNKLGEQHDDMMRRLSKLQAQKDKKIEDILAEHRRQRQEASDKRNDHKLRVKFQKLAQRAVRDSKNKPGMASQRVQELLKDIDLKALGMRDETKWELRRKYQEILEMKEKDENYAALFADRDMKKVERLFKTQINEMSVEDINDLITELSALAHYQENTDRLLKDSQGRSAAEVGRQIVKDLKELSPLEVTNPVKRLSAKYLRDNLSPERAFNRLSGYKHDNAMKTFYRTQVLDGLTKVKRFEQKADELKQEFINDEKNKYFLNNGSKQTIPVTDKYGRTAMISPAMRVSLYMASKNTDNLTHIATDGVTVPEPKTYAKGMIEDAYGRGTTLVLDPTDVKAICNGMTDSEKEFATLLKIFFDTYAKDAINETSVDLDGILKATVENYFPITSDKNFLAKSMDSFQDPTLEGWNNLKSRQEGANNKILLEDARQVLQRHIRNTARYHGLAVPMRNWGKVYGYTSHRDEATGTRNSVQSAIKNAWDADTADYIERLIRDDINSGGRKAERGIADAMRSAYAGATLTLNPSVALKQTTSYLMAGSILDSGSLMYGLAHGFTKKDEAYMDSITPWGWARRQGESTIELGDLARKMDPITKNTPNWNQAMDVWTTNRLFLATEESVKKEFKASKNEVLHDLKRGDKKYDDAVAERYNQVLWRTQPQYEAAFRPEYLRKTDVGSRTFGLFKTESMQMSGELIDAWGQWKADEKRTKDAKGIYDKHPGDQTKTVYETNEKYRKDSAKQFYRTFCSWVASNMLFAIMGTALNIGLLHKGKPYRNEKGEIDFETIAKKTALNFAGSSLGGFFYASTAADIGAYLYGKLSGENPTWYDIEVPGISLMNDAVENMGNLTGVLTNEEANNAAKAQAIAKFALAVSKFTPVGFAENIVNLANSVVLYNQDKKEGTLGKWEAGKGLLKDTSPTRDQYANRAVDAARKGDMATAERALKKTKKANLEKAVGRPITENMYKKIMEDPNNLRNYLGVALEDITPSIKNVPDHGYSSFTKLREDIGDPERTQNWHHIVEQEQMEEGLAGFKSTQVNNTNNIVSIPSGSKSPHSKISEYYGSVQDFTDGKTVREWLKDKSFEEQWEFGVKQLREYGDLVPTTNGWVFVPDKKKMEAKIPMEEGKAKEKTDTQRFWESRIAEAREDGSLKDNEIRTIALDMIREGISAEEAEALYRDKKKKEVEKLDKWIEEKGTFEDYLKGRNAISEAAAIKDKDKEKQAEKRKKAVEDYLRQYHGSYANELWLWELAGYSENTFEYH